MADILIDDREGSADLMRHFPKGVAELTRLEYGDVAFIGTGPAGRPITVGVEVKRLSDVLKCIVDGRFAGHQLPGLIETYKVRYLIVEGIFKADERTGILVQRRGKEWREVAVGARRFMAADLEAWLYTAELKAGVHIRVVSGARAAAITIYNMYKWWYKGWDSHKSHLALHSLEPDTSMIREASLIRKIAKELPGVGWQRSLAVEKHFSSIIAMMTANEAEWMKIEGIGKGIAANVVKQLREVRHVRGEG